MQHSQIEYLTEAGYTFVDGCLSISSGVVAGEYGKQQTFFGAALWLPGMSPNLKDFESQANEQDR